MSISSVGASKLKAMRFEAIGRARRYERRHRQDQQDSRGMRSSCPHTHEVWIHEVCALKFAKGRAPGCTGDLQVRRQPRRPSRTSREKLEGNPHGSYPRKFRRCLRRFVGRWADSKAREPDVSGARRAAIVLSFFGRVARA